MCSGDQKSGESDMSQKLEQFMSDVFDAMYENHEMEQAAELALAQLANFSQADVSYLAETSADGASIEMVYEWTKSGIRMDLKQLEGKRCGYGAEGQDIEFAAGIDRLPPQMKPVFEESGLHSLLQYPIRYQGRLNGYVGICGSSKAAEDWKDNPSLRSALNYLSRVLSVFIDKKRHEKQRAQDQKQYESSLKHSDLKAETANEILDQISTGVVVLKMPSYDKLLPIYGNLGQYRMLRIERTAVNASVPDEEEAELESQYFGDAFAGVHPDDMERVRGEYKAGYGTDHFSVKKYRLLRGDGSYVWVNADLRLQACTPEYKIFYATYTDVTEEHELQMQLSEALVRQKAISSELEKASEAKTDFLSRMSHDIRTPMNAILGLNTLAKNELEHAQTVKNYLDKMEASGRFLMGLLNDILDISSIERNVIELHPEPYRLEEFKQQVEALIVHQCRQKDIEFIFDTAGQHYSTIMVDKLRFNQIVFNLLNNAVRYTPRGGRIELLVREQKQENGRAYTRLVIRDNGIGMSSEFQKHMYEPFSQEGREAGNADGRSSGLGLAIVKSLVELMGGTINVRSELEKGTEFILDFQADIAPEAVCEEAAVEEPDICIKGVHVLLCEDNELNMEIAAYLLGDAGATTDWAKNGREAVELFEQSEPGYYDVILMDIRMPVMDGLEAARVIRSLERPDAIVVPIFAMTANAYEEDKRMSREAGMNEHLPKPIDAKLLYRMIWNYTKSGKI